MRSDYITPKFQSEKALCQAFILGVQPDWIVYPETAGWDVLLVHRVGGWQIGVEAKLTLNAKVLVQAMDGGRRASGPDFRAVLVGRVVAENATLARALGLTVITPEPERIYRGISRFQKQGPRLPKFAPELPQVERVEKIGQWWSPWCSGDWFDRVPEKRCGLPDYVPEVEAGVPSPMVLSEWKIKAMRVCVWVEKHATITRQVFRKLGIDPSRWMDGYWLEPAGPRGVWKKGKHFPGPQFKSQHPSIYEKVEADYPKWSTKVTEGALL